MDEKPFETMNVIPFVDIMLVLLTIVLTTSSFIASGRIPVNLPRASKSVTEADKAVVIELSAAGGVYFNGRPATLESLGSCWRPSAGRRASSSGRTRTSPCSALSTWRTS